MLKTMRWISKNCWFYLRIERKKNRQRDNKNCEWEFVKLKIKREKGVKWFFFFTMCVNLNGCVTLNDDICFENAVFFMCIQSSSYQSYLFVELKSHSSSDDWFQSNIAYFQHVFLSRRIWGAHFIWMHWIYSNSFFSCKIEKKSVMKS